VPMMAVLAATAIAGLVMQILAGREAEAAGA
jgi:hypothetical protein